MKLNTFILSLVITLGTVWANAQSLCNSVFSTSSSVELHLDRTAVSVRSQVGSKLADNKQWEQIFAETELLPWALTFKSHRKNEALANNHINILNRYIKSGQVELSPLKDLSKLDLGKWTTPDVIKILNRSGLSKAKINLSPDAQKQFDSLLKWLVNNRNQIDPRSEVHLDSFIEGLANVTQKIIKERTFGDATETTAQILMVSALKPLGVLAPRLSDYGLAKNSSLETWVAAVRQGIKNHEELVADMSNRLQFGLKLEDSPWLKFAEVPTKVVVNFKLPSQDKATPGKNEVFVDPGQFLIFFNHMSQKRADLIDALDRSPAEGMSVAKDLYDAFLKKNHLEFKHAKNGIEMINLNLVDKDFSGLFGASTHNQTDLFNYKMERWYEQEVVWRGWSHLQRVIPENELLAMFTTSSAQMVSNRLLGIAYNKGTPAQLVAGAKQAFDVYNRDLMEGTAFYQMMKDHHQEGPLYRSSYGYSTSKNWTVGRAFAMGAMKVADYGQQHLHQDKVKSRILIGVRQAKKDVDQGRLHQFNDDYQYIYGRQQEITGIAMAEPDSLSVIQKVNPEGAVETTYLRDPQAPNMILKIDGDYRPQRGDDWNNFPYSRLKLD